MDRIPSPFDETGAKYENEARKKAYVVAKEIWYDDGYRHAVQGEIVKVSPDDFALLLRVGQICDVSKAPAPGEPVPVMPKQPDAPVVPIVKLNDPE